MPNDSLDEEDREVSRDDRHSSGGVRRKSGALAKR
jgi:hypothetical protein